MNKEDYEELCLVDRDMIDYIIYSLRQRDMELDKRLNLQQRIDKAITDIETTIQIIKEQPSKNVEEDNYILSRLESFVEILRGKK